MTTACASRPRVTSTSNLAAIAAELVALTGAGVYPHVAGGWSTSAVGVVVYLRTIGTYSESMGPDGYPVWAVCESRAIAEAMAEALDNITEGARSRSGAMTHMNPFGFGAETIEYTIEAGNRVLVGEARLPARGVTLHDVADHDTAADAAYRACELGKENCACVSTQVHILRVDANSMGVSPQEIIGFYLEGAELELALSRI